MAEFPLAEEELAGKFVSSARRETLRTLKYRKCSYTHLRNKRARKEKPKRWPISFLLCLALFSAAAFVQAPCFPKMFLSGLNSY